MATLEGCRITFSWGTEIGKGGPVLAAKIGPGDRFWRQTDFFITVHIGNEFDYFQIYNSWVSSEKIMRFYRKDKKN